MAPEPLGEAALNELVGGLGVDYRHIASRGCDLSRILVAGLAFLGNPKSGDGNRR